MRKPAAIYARVSSDRQREHETIASQTTALQAYADTHDYLVPPAWVFEDDGYSGATLVRPGLEALRDLAAAGQIDAALVYAPDRLSRKYAYQILLTEELARCGVSLVFLQSPPGTTPEDHLLLQVQGMIAEYERAQIAERTRRGKRHKAKRGVVNALSAAPYGYQYVRKSDHADAYYHVNETAAAMVRQVFEAYTREGLSINALARRLNERRVPTRTGARWERGTIWKMLRNPAYYGKACFGKTAARPRHRITRRLRLKGRVPSRDSANVARPRSEWVEIAVPPLISDETFALAQERLQQNKQYARRRTTTPTLLQGLLVCAQCGYSLYRQRVYYRCIGIDGYRHAHGPVCTNRPIRQDRLDALVWRELLRLLDDPTLIQAELDRRLDAARHAAPGRQRGDDLARQQARVAKSLDRLVTAYQQELVTLDELRDRIAPLRLDELDATPLRGTQGGFAPFFSPDGEWVAFSNIRNGDLMRVPSVGGQPETICTCGMFPTLRGQSWGPDDTIVFGMEGSEGLWQVSAVGGEPELLTRVDPAQEMDHRHPWILPDGKAVLFTAWSGSDESSRIALASMETGEVSYLMAGSGAQYTQSGHVVYGAGRGILRAVGFDAERGELTSDNPVPVLENVAVFFGGMPPFSVSDTGSIAYVLGYGAGNPFVWVDSGGGEEPLGLPALLHLTFQLSPGDDRIAVEIDGIAGNSDISVYDLESGNLTQLTSSSERECCPLWSPDGARVVFTSWRGGAPNLYSTAADGSGSATRLTDDDLTQFAYGWLDGGTTLLLIQDDDLYALWPDGRSTPTRLLQTEWREERPTLSPNGRWIAFESERAGPRAVEVRALADVVDGSWWTVSPRETGTYDEALWSPDGRQLFFRSQTEMMVVPIDTGPQFRWGPPEPLFPYPGFIRMVGIGATMSLGMGVSLC